MEALSGNSGWLPLPSIGGDVMSAGHHGGGYEEQRANGCNNIVLVYERFRWYLLSSHRQTNPCLAFGSNVPSQNGIDDHPDFALVSCQA